MLPRSQQVRMKTGENAAGMGRNQALLGHSVWGEQCGDSPGETLLP